MKPIYTWSAKPTTRNLTVADLRAGKGKNILARVFANIEKEGP